MWVHTPFELHSMPPPTPLKIIDIASLSWVAKKRIRIVGWLNEDSMWFVLTLSNC